MLADELGRGRCRPTVSVLVEILSGELLEKHSDEPTNVVGRTTTTRSVFSSVIKGCVGAQDCCAGVVGRTVFSWEGGVQKQMALPEGTRGRAYEQVGRRATTMGIEFFYKNAIMYVCDNLNI